MLSCSTLGLPLNELFGMLRKRDVRHHGNAVALERHIPIAAVLHYPISGPLVDLEQDVAARQILIDCEDRAGLSSVAQVHQHRAEATSIPPGNDGVDGEDASVPRRE